MDQASLAAFSWSGAELLRGDCKQAGYDLGILPLTVLRRPDGVLTPTGSALLADSAAKFTQ
ncbi:MAG: hypothetical protein ABI389_14520 [Rhodanobacter sp.]